MRKTKTTFLFRRMMLIVLAFLGYAAMTQAQVYVVDDFVKTLHLVSNTASRRVSICYRMMSLRSICTMGILSMCLK